ncbi:MAG: crotonase/enoyl-CoA hydratase family protein [Burkholderiaceae bacterium]|jgi:enoyl-CoA hydratase/carnithine racemase
MSHPEGEIVIERRDHLFLIGVNRPAKLNGYTPKMTRELAAAYTAFEDDAALRCAILHAIGEHFTAGLDLPSMAPLLKRGESSMPLEYIDPFDLRADRLGRRRTKPLIAAVRGITYTIGIELMLAADIVIAATDCRFSQLEVKRGIMATGGATIRIAERAGLGNALLHLLTGDEFGADDALRMGLVQKVVKPGEELALALDVAARIAQQAPLAVVATRENALLGVREGPAAAYAQFSAIQARLANSDDAAEGVRSFVEKRAARFTGS